MTKKGKKITTPPCGLCGKRIVLPDGGYSTLCGVYRCDNCPITDEEREKIIREYKKNTDAK